MITVSELLDALMVEHGGLGFHSDSVQLKIIVDEVNAILDRQEAAANKRDDNDQAAITAAREEHESEGTLEIDENAIVSFSSDGGAYVAAWVWVDNSAIEAQGGINPETAGPEEEDAA
jgi:hypothetical protein